MKELVKMNQGLLDNFFDEQYFEKLYIKIMNELKNEVVYVKNLYVSIDSIKREELGYKETINPSFFDKKIYNMKRESLCFKELLDEKGISVYPILIVKASQEFLNEYSTFYSQRYVYKDIITGFLFPLLNVKFFNKGGFDMNFDFFYDEKKEKVLDIFTTNYFMLDATGSPEIYNKQYPEFDFFVDDYKSTRLVNLEELEMYVRNICNRDNYLKYINFFIYYLRKIAFEEIYDISAFIPQSLIPYYEKVKDINKDKLLQYEEINENRLKEKKDAIFYNFEMIMEIKNLINGLSDDKKFIYYHKLDNLIQKYSKIILEVNPNLVFNFQQELSKLRADIMTYEMSLFQYETFYKYLENIYHLSKRPFLKEDLEKIVVDLFQYIQQFLSSKDKLEFDKYYQSQELICSCFLNILIFNPDIRGYILKNITDLYQKGIQEKIGILLNDCIENLDENNLNSISIYSLILKKLPDIDFINEGLINIDKLEREFVLNVIEQSSRKKLIKKKNIDIE